MQYTEDTKIDVIIPIYYNYQLINDQVNRWKNIKGNWRLLFCDNTPAEHALNLQSDNDRIKFYRNDSVGIDGERHGGVLDYMVKQAETDIICIMDSDYFWLDNDIISHVIKYFNDGYKCVGSELFYTGFAYVNDMYPNRAGWLAPCVFGMFIDRNLASSETFVCTKYEGFQERKETGWRMRKKIIDEKIKCYTFPALQLIQQFTNTNINELNKVWFYAGNHKLIGVHLVQGSGVKKELTSALLKEIYSMCGIQNN